MLGQSLVRKVVATAVAAGAAFVVVVAVAATIYHLLAMLLVPAAAAALTGVIFAVFALVVAMVALGKTDVLTEDEPEGLGERAFALFRDRPMMGVAAALAGGWIFLRNPALATMVAAAFTEKSHRRHRR